VKRSYLKHTTKTDKAFIKKLKFLRKNKDITQAQLAAAIGISLSTLRHIENGEQRVYLSDALIILSHLGVDRINIAGKK
jgi:transcriptional regulator with XRE-family HTH domain